MGIVAAIIVGILAIIGLSVLLGAEGAALGIFTIIIGAILNGIIGAIGGVIGTDIASR